MMMRRISAYAFFLFIQVMCVTPYAQNVDTTLYKEQMQYLKEALSDHHFDPKDFNNILSENLLYHFLDNIDPHHLHFTKEDYIELRSYRSRLDNEFRGESWMFVPLVLTKYKQALLRSQKLIDEILAKPFDFTANEMIHFSEGDTTDYASTGEEHRMRWYKWLKYKTLWRMMDITEGHADASEKSLLANEVVARERVRKIEGRKIKRKLEYPDGYENYIVSIYLNTLVSCFDPHSLYLTKTDFENFRAEISPDNYSFGIDFAENDKGDIYISRLVPGGPAWKCNELHKGDVLVQLKWEGKEAIDISGAYLYEIEQIIASSNSEKLEFTVRKASGQENKIILTKEKLRADENIVRSFVLKGEKRIGYISLPGFYTQWENNSVEGCSNDVAKEIIKLQKENIDGIILDIRYNGGGSLMEGSNLAGIFIDEGPMFMMVNRSGTPTVMKDMNRGTIYSGPLIVMVNGESASASEVLASTLQDYNRALIVGSNTFGKATGQNIIPIDPSLMYSEQALDNPDSPHGYLSVTKIKLYRITGKSAQLKGVKPDVVLPDIYDKQDFRESSYPFALPYDTVNKKTYYTLLPAIPVKELSEKSYQRQTASAEFNRIKVVSDSLPIVMGKEDNDLSLKLSNFKKYAQLFYHLTQSLDSVAVKKTDLFTIENTSYDKELMQMDLYTQEVNKSLMENIQNDLYIEETYRIMLDYILIGKKDTRY